jgi:uncharacterized protein YqjF (DUF2071 family)
VGKQVGVMLLQSLQGIGEALLSPARRVSDSFRHGEVLRETDHRPWPLPDRPWFMGQTWMNLLFAHWRVPKEALEAVVPAQLPIDTRDGSAWIGVTPFVVRNLRLRGTPPVPVVSSFPEINVRTYVTVEDRPGIYFLSLDAGSSLAVRAARLTYRLPYYHSRIATAGDAAEFEFESTRTSDDGPPASFAARYGSDGEPLPWRPESLERWLTERYCLYTFDEHLRVQRGEVHHPPWPLRPAWAEIETNTMAQPFGIALEGEPLLHLSPRQDVALWQIEPVPDLPRQRH